MSKWFFVPEEWEISSALRKWAYGKGLSDRQIDELEEAFRDHQFKRPMMRADACFRNWIRNAIKWGDVTPAVTKQYRRPEELSNEQRQADLLKWEQDMKRLKVVK